jgi:hypothetical protein
MSNTVLGGTSLPRYPDPLVRGIPNEYGLYPWSVIDASLVSLSGSGEIISSSFTAASATIPLLLFTSDIPVSLAGRILPTVPPFIGTNPMPQTYYEQTQVFSTNLFTELHTESGGSTDVVVTVGKVAQGYVGTVYCSGFPAALGISTYGLTASEGDPLPYLINFRAIAKGAVIDGVPFFVSTLPSFFQSGVILRASDYTQAIYDAGNVIQTPTVTAQVVGLWAGPVLPPG